MDLQGVERRIQVVLQAELHQQVHHGVAGQDTAGLLGCLHARPPQPAGPAGFLVHEVQRGLLVSVRFPGDTLQTTAPGSSGQEHWAQTPCLGKPVPGGPRHALRRDGSVRTRVVTNTQCARPVTSPPGRAGPKSWRGTEATPSPGTANSGQQSQGETREGSRPGRHVAPERSTTS